MSSTLSLWWFLEASFPGECIDPIHRIYYRNSYFVYATGFSLAELLRGCSVLPWSRAAGIELFEKKKKNNEIWLLKREHYIRFTGSQSWKVGQCPVFL